ncbi:MAG TPA: NAD(P)(+) transhydrogenase (Re/Si-specific) subunit beta, partial [bacterium]|nr:NAD(P)(+) transhydrogenase (Re/Si-specific) subunit beta [bacterium]
MSANITQLAYLIATALFILALHWMNDPKTARKGVMSGVIGMTLAIAATWIQPDIMIHHGWILAAVLLGIGIGYPLALVPLTAVPQRTALSHAFGGLAASLVGAAEFFHWLHAAPQEMTTFNMVALLAEVGLGGLTVTGSLMAAGKLQGVSWIPQRPVTYPGQNFVNLLLLLLAIGLGAALVHDPSQAYAAWIFAGLVAIALLFGVLLIIPIGGADMPTVISILNSYA